MQEKLASEAMKVVSKILVTSSIDVLLGALAVPGGGTSALLGDIFLDALLWAAALSWRS